MQRLTNHYPCYQPYVISANKPIWREIYDKLCAFEDAEEQGRLVVLPCKVGDTLYEVDLPEYGVIVCKVLYADAYCGPFAHVIGAEIVNAISVGVEVIDGHGKGSSYAFEYGDFGKTVFLTREEAEAKLREVEHE